jgi:hypothetical protein
MCIALIAALLAASPGLAQPLAPTCGPYASLVAEFAQESRQRPGARGSGACSGGVEVVAAADGASSTILVIGPHGVACIATHGRAWRAILPGAPS